MPESLETVSLRTGQIAQIQDQFRVEMYNLQLRFDLLIKMLEEKGVLTKGAANSPGEFDKRWPLYLKNDIGVMGPDGSMDGHCAINFYGIDI